MITSSAIFSLIDFQHKLSGRVGGWGRKVISVNAISSPILNGMPPKSNTLNIIYIKNQTHRKPHDLKPTPKQHQKEI
jgi:hypothetical protein